jgi:hypothetical protein
MKTRLVASALMLLSAFTGVHAQSANQQVQPPVFIESENKLLTRAYVQAFGALVRPPFTLTMQRENIMYVIEDVRGVKDVGGLLVVEVGRGFNYVVNPKDIVAISDGPAIRGDR